MITFTLNKETKTVKIETPSQEMTVKQVTVKGVTFFQGTENESTLCSNKEMVIPKGRAIRILESFFKGEELDYSFASVSGNQVTYKFADL